MHSGSCFNGAEVGADHAGFVSARGGAGAAMEGHGEGSGREGSLFGADVGQQGRGHGLGAEGIERGGGGSGLGAFAATAPRGEAAEIGGQHDGAPAGPASGGNGGRVHAAKIPQAVGHGRSQHSATPLDGQLGLIARRGVGGGKFAAKEVGHGALHGFVGLFLGGHVERGGSGVFDFGEQALGDLVVVFGHGRSLLASKDGANGARIYKSSGKTPEVG